MISLGKLTREADEKFLQKLKESKEDLNLNIEDFETKKIDEIEIDEKKIFKNKFELAKYLYETLPNTEIETRVWHFLVIIYHQQLLKKGKAGEIERFYYKDSFHNKHIHLLKSPYEFYQLYSKKPDLIEFLFSNPVNENGAFFLEITKRPSIMRNRQFIKVCKQLFCKEGKIVGSVDLLKRLITLFNQYDRTYDMYGMPSEKIISDLLTRHSEFTDIISD